MEGDYYLKDGGYGQVELADSKYQATYYLDVSGKYVRDQWKEIDSLNVIFRKYGNGYKQMGWLFNPNLTVAMAANELVLWPNVQ